MIKWRADEVGEKRTWRRMGNQAACWGLKEMPYRCIYTLGIFCILLKPEIPVVVTCFRFFF